MTTFVGQQPVFLHYSQEELNRNFDQRGWISNAEEIIARYLSRSAATGRKFAAKQYYSYGNHADEKLTVFRSQTKAPAPLAIFVHGGAWRNFTKDDYLFVAETFVPAAFHTAVLNFSKLPMASLPDVVDQVRRGITWIHDNAALLGADPEAIVLAAQSSGAHLSAMALAQLGSVGFDFGQIVRSAFLVSGPYDLEPVMLSARGSYVKLDHSEVRRFSPVYNADAIACPVYVAYAEFDTDEFKRQSLAFASALRGAGKLEACREFAGLNHFELMEQFGDPQSQLAQTVVHWAYDAVSGR